MLNGFKGQGALEYLLLIGGAVVVAAVVIVLLLGTSGSGGGQTEAGTVTAYCAQAAVAANPSSPKCSDVVPGGTADSAYIWNNKTNSCWQCVGTYPSCAANKTTITSDNLCNGGNNLDI